MNGSQLCTLLLCTSPPLVLLLGVALISQKLRLPVARITVIAGLLLGLMIGSRAAFEAPYLISALPLVIADKIHPLGPPFPSGSWMLQKPQLHALVSMVFWGFVGAGGAALVKRWASVLTDSRRHSQ